jgi:hypothetical protein
LLNHKIAPRPVIRKVLFQKIREKKQFQNKKEYKEFYQNDDPEFLAHCHSPETIIIKPENLHR